MGVGVSRQFFAKFFMQDIEIITLKTLIKLYGKEIATRIYKERADTLLSYHGLAWELGRRSFYYFNRVFLGDFLFDYSGKKIPLSETHYKIWDELEYTILNKNDTKDVFIMPRGCGKTHTIGVPTAIWCALYGLHHYILIQSSVQDRAEEFISLIKDRIEGNKLIEQSFGNIFNRKMTYNSTEIELDTKPQSAKIKAFSSTGGVRGTGYRDERVGLLIIDDGQEYSQVSSEEGREKLFKQLFSGVMNTLETANCHIIAFGTLLFPDDLYDRLIHLKTWRKHLYKCILVDNVTEYFQTNEHYAHLIDLYASDPDALEAVEKYYKEHYDEMQLPLIWNKWDSLQLFNSWFPSPVIFEREFQGNIDSFGEKRIHSLSAVSADTIEGFEYSKTVLSVDPAAVNTKKSDFYAFTVLSERKDNKIKYARKCEILKFDTFDEYIDHIIKLLLDYTDIDLLSIEKNVYSGADVVKLREKIADNPELRNRSLEIKNLMRNQNKDARIESYAIPDINTGRIVFNEDDKEAIEQIKSFAGCKNTLHDDALDSVADANQMLMTIQNKHYFHVYPLNY